MNGLSIAERVYLGSMETTRSERRSEYEVIARITRRLRDAARAQKTDFSGFVEALDLNRQLWQIFAIDVADDQNPLPQELRARIFYLAEFTEIHTRKVLREKASIMPLLEVNMAVLRGLKPEGIAK
ncbi:MAG: flagellar biosynthesis regulator FlaF [Hyphomicrobiales bacterium]